MTFEVGEVLYLLSVKNHKIVPARIEAITTVKKLEGQDVTHELSVPGYDETVLLESLSVKAFKDTKKLKNYVLKVIRQKLDSDIAEVVSTAQSTWTLPVQQKKKQSKVQQLVDEPLEPDSTVEIELEDGTRARVHMPQELV